MEIILPYSYDNADGKSLQNAHIALDEDFAEFGAIPNSWDYRFSFEQVQLIYTAMVNARKNEAKV